MKTRVLVAGAGIAVLIAGMAFAQIGERGERMLKRMDTDGDGRISDAESEAFRVERFRSMDADGDGFVTMEEMPDGMHGRHGMRGRHAGRFEERFNALDTNGNGMVEKAEYDAMADQRFARMDSNGDGVLSLDELREHRQKHHQRHKDG